MNWFFIWELSMCKFPDADFVCWIRVCKLSIFWARLIEQTLTRSKTAKNFSWKLNLPVRERICNLTIFWTLYGAFTRPAISVIVRQSNPCASSPRRETMLEISFWSESLVSIKNIKNVLWNIDLQGFRPIKWRWRLEP